MAGDRVVPGVAVCWGGAVSPVTSPPARTLQEWIDVMLAADPEDTTRIAMDAMKADGCALADLVCVRHGMTVRWIALGRHLRETGVHDRGEVRPRSVADRPPTSPWSTSACRSCGALVVWAITPRGKRMPVDVEPSPAGNVVLVDPEDPTDPPRVVLLHTESERATVPVEKLHTSHFATCTHAAEHRRPR